MGRFQDLTGNIYGNLTVISRSGTASNGSAIWKCLCECGNYADVRGDKLKNGEISSCGCMQLNNIDLTGQKINMISVIKRVGSDKNGKALYRCKCDCGTIKTMTAGDLKSGRVVSCGCYAYSFLNKLHEGNKIHGFSGTRIYHVWRGMLQRCENHNNSAYKDYGGRGITICEEWHDVKKFADWAYQNGYDENAERGDCTIDRIDVNGNYEPSNCRWVDMRIQNNNKRNNKK